MKVGTFYGGLTLPSPAAATSSFEEIPPPEVVTIPLRQHTGNACEASVKKKAEIKMGDLVGGGSETDTTVASVHASVSGVVTDVIKRFPDTHGGYAPAVVIESDGKNEWGGDSEGTDPMDLIEKAGVVDCDTAAVPLHGKLALAKEKSVNTLIINGVDVEPQLTSRASLLAESAPQVAVGIDIIKSIVGAASVYVGVSENASRAISAISGECGSAGISPLKAKHPQSLKELLVKAILGKEIPSSGIPEDIGVTVISAETAFFAARAVDEKKPVLERFITVAGPGVGNPRNVLVRIGTPIKDVLAYWGVSTGDTGKVIIGGPLMGTAIHTTEIPVTKETTGIYVQKEGDIAEFPSGVCVKCGLCVQVCPMRLMPLLISGFSETGNYSLAKENDIFSCIECGCCAYVCPVFIPLVQWIQLGKSEIRAQKE